MAVNDEINLKSVPQYVSLHNTHYKFNLLRPRMLNLDATTEDVSVDWAVITQHISNGDISGFGAYYEAFFDIMFREAQRLIGNHEATCLDLVQDAMLKAMRSMKVIKDEGELTAWTKVVVRSVVLDHLRKETRIQMLERSQPASDLIDSNSSDGLHTIEIQARTLWVEEQLKNLKPELRQLISMRYRWGWTLQKIGQKLGIKPGAVDGKIRRAVEKLRSDAQREIQYEKL